MLTEVGMLKLQEWRYSHREPEAPKWGTGRRRFLDVEFGLGLGTRGNGGDREGALTERQGSETKNRRGQGRNQDRVRREQDERWEGQRGDSEGVRGG